MGRSTANIQFFKDGLVKDHWAMLHTKFQASRPSGSEKEDF